jgi:6-pyruvoyltetrahydropterin/6-carboxytetrahydropterin synthase
VGDHQKLNNMARYLSAKKFTNFSVALRQWKAQHSHCQLLHGYAFEIKVWFASNEPDVEDQLDEMNWIVDYGGFKTPPHGNGLKRLDEMICGIIPHLIEQADDPYRDIFAASADIWRV